MENSDLGTIRDLSDTELDMVAGSKGLGLSLTLNLSTNVNTVVVDQIATQIAVLSSSIQKIVQITFAQA